MSTVSPVPKIIDALVVLGEALPNVVTYDGFGVSNETGSYLMIGVEDPDIETAQQSAQSAQDWPVASSQPRDERGEITCAAHVWNGDTGQPGAKAARDGVYAIADGLATAIRTDYTLGAVPGLLWAAYGTSAVLSQAQDDKGSAALLVFKVAYFARLHP